MEKLEQKRREERKKLIMLRAKDTKNKNTKERRLIREEIQEKEEEYESLMENIELRV